MTKLQHMIKALSMSMFFVVATLTIPSAATAQYYDFGDSYPYNYGDSYGYDYGDSYPYDYGDGYSYDYGDSYGYDYGYYDDYGYDYYDGYGYDYYDTYDYDYYDDYGWDYIPDYGYDYVVDTHNYYRQPAQKTVVYDDYGYSYNYTQTVVNETNYDYDYNYNYDYNYDYTYNYTSHEDSDDEFVSATCDSFSVSDDEVEAGDRVTLHWNTTGGDAVSISPNVGTVSNDGSRTVRVYNDTTFKLTVENEDDTDTCSVHVVIEEEDDDDRKNPSLRCDLDASDTRIDEGDRVTLRWEAEGAEEVRLTDDRGNDWLERYNLDEDDEYDGSIRVYPKRDTEYTLTVENGSRDRDCEVRVRVNEDDDDDNKNEVVVYTYQPPITGVYLGNAPYTGVDAKTALMYGLYSLVFLWALYGAYYVTIRRKQDANTSIKM